MSFRTPVPSEYRVALDDAFALFLETDEEKYLAKFLTTDQAYEIYQKAYQHFLKYQVVHPENQERYKKAKQSTNIRDFATLLTL